MGFKLSAHLFIIAKVYFLLLNDVSDVPSARRFHLDFATIIEDAAISWGFAR